MDVYNLERIKNVIPHQRYLSKVDFIYNEIYPGSNKFVEDPYYGNDSDFEKTYHILDRATEKIAQKIFAMQNI